VGGGGGGGGGGGDLQAMANKLKKGLGSWSSDEPAVDNGRPGKKGGNKAKVAVAKAATARGMKPAFGRVLRRTRVTHKSPVYNTCEFNACTRTHTHKYMYIYIHIYIYIYIYGYIYINMCVNIHVCIYVYVYMYLHIYCKYISHFSKPRIFVDFTCAANNTTFSVLSLCVLEILESTTMVSSGRFRILRGTSVKRQRCWTYARITPRQHAQIHIYVNTHMYVYVYIHIHIHIPICICMYMYVYAYVCTFIRMCIHVQAVL